MTTQPETKKRSLKTILVGWICRIVVRPGWTRWVALAVAAVLFVLSAFHLTRSTDYREDPSALVPRSADVYAETRDLSSLLKTAGAWTLWHADRRGDGTEARNDLEKELAARISARVGGLPINPPLRWMASSLGAAWCVSREAPEGGADGADAADSWALYLRLEDPAAVLGEIEVEPGITLETVQGGRGGDGVFSLAGKDGTVFVGIVGPWLIFSGDDKLPAFALEAKRRPSLSLAGSEMLPAWRRGAGLRGLVNPSSSAARSPAFAPAFVTDWLSPAARVVYTAVLGRSGGAELRLATAELTDSAPGAALWPVMFVLMAALAVASLAVIFAILLVMVGWGGWLKALAVKAGAAPASAPERVEPSRAFREDAGADAEKPAGSAGKAAEDADTNGGRS